MQNSCTFYNDNGYLSIGGWFGGHKLRQNERAVEDDDGDERGIR